MPVEPLDTGARLVRTPEGLCLTDGTMTVRGDFQGMSRRIRRPNIGNELLVRAARLKGAENPLAVDATAGLGEDALLLAAAGFHVTMFERNPQVATLLQDALDRGMAQPGLADALGRMSLLIADSRDGLATLDFEPDVVFLDPMFPQKRKYSAAKKKLQLLQKLELPCEDEEALLAAAVSANPRKIVVKRPVKGPTLAGMKPSYSLSGKAVRYDCLVLR